MIVELFQFEKNEVWRLLLKPKDHLVVGTKWVFRNKLNEFENVVGNKTRLVVQGYSQQEGIDYDETYTLIVRLESIKKLLSFACFRNFKLYQMDIKSSLLNGFLNEEVYVKQTPSFEKKDASNHLFKLTKVLYGLKQAFRA